MRNPISDEEYYRFKQLEPWQLTLTQFLEVLNHRSGKKWLEDYRPWTIESFDWVKKADRPILIDRHQFTTPFGKRWIEFRSSGEKNIYAKKDENTDEYLRLPNDDLVYYTDEEVLANKWALYSIDIYAFDGTTCVGSVADEWGGTLLAIAKEYWRSKIGIYLYRLFNTRNPYRCSGGFTNDGLRLMRAVHQSYVKDALAAGKPVELPVLQSSCRHIEVINHSTPQNICHGCEHHREREGIKLHYRIHCLQCNLSGIYCTRSELLLWDNGTFIDARMR